MPTEGDKLTPREKQFIKARVKGKSKKDAAIEAGVTGPRPDQAGWKLEKSIEAKDEGKAALIKNGLSLDVLIQKYLKPALEDKNRIVSLRALHMALMMHGAYKAEQINTAGGIKCIIIDAGKRPPRQPTIEIPFQPPSLEDAERAS